MVFLDVLKLIFAVFVAFLFGKLVSKLKLPAILGWLLAGMTLGPHALGLLNEPMMEAAWYTTAESILECVVGLMIGTELIWRKIKKAGKQIVVTTITESLGTFLVVSLVFGVIFGITGVPLYLAFLFGGIALATAPAPSLSIVNEMKTAGPVTSTLIPMAALDDLVGALVFFTVVALVSAHVSTAGIPVLGVLFLVFLPVLIGAATGFVAGKLLPKAHTASGALAAMLLLLLCSAAIGMVLNQYVLPVPAINFFAYWYGVFDGVCKYDFRETACRNHESDGPCDRNKPDHRDTESGGAAGLPFDFRSRPLYRHLYHGPGDRQIQRCIFGRIRHACAADSQKIFRVYVAAAFGSIAGVYRHRGLCTERPGAGVCFYHSRNDCSRSGYQ